MNSQYKYTIFGCAAILLWSGLVGISRIGMEEFGPLGGAACMYSVSSVLLLIFVGIPKISTFSWKYLIIGSVLFASYEVLFSLSFGMANDRKQAIEVSIVNYLWPALTVLLATLSEKKGNRILLYPSLIIAFLGVMLSLNGENQLSISSWMDHINTNPIVYVMAFIGAIIWAVYCNVTKHQKLSGNLITVFFIATSMALWVKFFITPDSSIDVTWTGSGYLLLSSAIMAGGYALWNIAIVKGNMVFLATLSYFTPIFSAIISSITLSVLLPNTFWLGVVMVTIGSLMSWFSTRHKAQSLELEME